MKKQTIKCDSCKKEITEGVYYDLSVNFITGWVAFVEPHPNGVPGQRQICSDCMEKKLGIKV